MKQHLTNFTKVLIALAISFNAFAQNNPDQSIEEVVVTGSQIKGANIKGILPVTVLSSEDIEGLGIGSGDELLESIPENGQNFFNEAEGFSGGVNSARGDIGAYNLRNLGTGNTLALLNGRRLVNAATFQTEEIGGSSVPVTTSNSNLIPVFGISRVEILKDGASALYGADAVAGVINTVLKNDFEGFNIRYKLTQYENLSRGQQNLNIEFGKNFGGGKGNIGVFVDYFDRDKINAQDDPKWADSDHRRLVPDSSPWSGSTQFRNTSINSQYGQFDVVSGLDASHTLLVNNVTDSSGEFITAPTGNSLCDHEDAFVINDNLCGLRDNAGSNLRYNLWGNTDLRSSLTRLNMFSYLTYDFGGTEFFGELAYYIADSQTRSLPSAAFSTVHLRMSPDAYYNPFGSGGGRLPADIIGDSVPAEGLELRIDNYRFVEVPRIVNVDAATYRLLGGLRGTFNSWDWEGAIVLSEATRDDVTNDRVSNTLITELINRTTADAYNPFHGLANPTKADTNIEPALVDVFRKATSGLTMVDFKVTNPSLFSMAGGDAALLVGFEMRQESFEDDRDPRLDGTILYTDNDGDEYPYVSDVVNSSPTPDTSGDRTVVSLFSEIILPITNNLTVQGALRYEDYSDADSPLVGKLAFGWQPHDVFLLRGSVQQSFRAPNLVTINEQMVARQNTRNDYVCFFVDPDEDELDCQYSLQRTTVGSDQLVSEESINTSVGIVLTPSNRWTFTIDLWSIEKNNTIGLFGEENHTILELLNLINAGTADCTNTDGSTAVVREGVTEYDETQLALFTSKGICPSGAITRIDDQYDNLDTRTLEGMDIGVYYNYDAGWAKVDYKLNYSILSKYEQEASGNSLLLLNAANNGTLPANIPVDGFGDILGRDGNQEERFRMSARFSFDEGIAYGISWNRIGSFYQSSLTLSDGTRYEIPAMNTFNTNLSIEKDNVRIRLGINNFTNARAPLADRYFAYFPDAHNDFGRYFYLDVKVKVN